ncbi:MAG: hypothetical protein AB7U20_00655 [Planctomycetaceae bacterium]
MSHLRSEISDLKSRTSAVIRAS